MEQARQESRLRCVSQDDLAAPYRKREAAKHEALCKALGEHLGITLSLEEFFFRQDDEGEALYFVNGLAFARIQGDSRLLIITCAYILAEEKLPGAGLGSEIAPDS